jgi:hypothetical protein
MCLRKLLTRFIDVQGENLEQTLPLKNLSFSLS